MAVTGLNEWRVGLGVLVAVLLVGCNTTSPQPPKIQNPEIKVAELGLPKAAKIANNLPPLTLNEDHNSSRFDSKLQQQIEKQNPIVLSDESQPLPKLLNKRQICKDNVEVTYPLKDGDGYQNHHFALVQLQGRLMAIEQQSKEIKVKLFGWFSDNANLIQWAPYMDAPPKTESFQVVKGTNIWVSHEGWYFCSFTDDINSSI